MNKLNELAKRFQEKLAQTATPDKESQLRQKLNSDLTVNLANRNWGEVGFDSLYVTKNTSGSTTVNCNLIIPANSAPFTDKRKYPQGLNQFKQEMMDMILRSAQSLGINDLVQIITVNGK